MELMKNWFTYIYLTVFSTFIGYSLFSSVLNIGMSAKYPFIWYGGILIAMGGVWLVANAAGFLLSYYKLHNNQKFNGPISKITETVMVASIMAVGLIARIWIINNIPMEPASDFKSFYNMAKLLADGNLMKDGVGYCDYISQFPHVMGFSFALSIVFRLFGATVKSGLYFNLFASMISVFFCYRISRLISGRIGGIISLVLVAFWPSQILYIDQLASEPLYSALILLCVWIFTYLIKKPFETVNTYVLLTLNILLGIVLAVAGAVRPLSVIVLFAIAILILPYSIKLNKVKFNTGLIKSIMSKGWIRVSIIFICYFSCSILLTGAASRAIDRDLPGITVAFGYNLLVGMNTSSNGAWNEQDARYLNDTFLETGSAVEAQAASRELAFKRIAADPIGSVNLSLKKFHLLWSNDDYAAYWNKLFLQQQNNLTQKKLLLINSAGVWNNIYYIFSLYFSFIAGMFLWFRKKVGPEHVFVLIFVGTALVHMILESQNRYHYNILPVFAMLSANGIIQIFRYYKRKKEVQNGDSNNLEAPQKDDNNNYFSISELPLKNSNSFDMLQAIKDGHVKVTVSEEYIRNIINKDIIKRKDKEPEGYK